MTAIKLTPQLINGLQCPPGRKRFEYCDTEFPGFYVEVRATSPGGGTYYLRYKGADRKTHHLLIGHTVSFPVK